MCSTRTADRGVNPLNCSGGVGGLSDLAHRIVQSISLIPVSRQTNSGVVGHIGSSIFFLNLTFNVWVGFRVSISARQKLNFDAFTSYYHI